MPDISMCQQDECPKKEKCYRFTAIPSKSMQSYFNPMDFKEGKCEYFVEEKKYIQQITRNNL